MSTWFPDPDRNANKRAVRRGRGGDPARAPTTAAAAAAVRARSLSPCFLRIIYRRMIGLKNFSPARFALYISLSLDPREVLYIQYNYHVSCEFDRLSGSL